MEGETLSQVEMQEICEIEKDGKVEEILNDRLRATENYQTALAFWRSPAGMKAIRNSRLTKTI